MQCLVALLSAGAVGFLSQGSVEAEPATVAGGGMPPQSTIDERHSTDNSEMRL
jgi:hypothetical protein